jgi:hypothetical protein
MFGTERSYFRYVVMGLIGLTVLAMYLIEGKG